MKKYLLVFLAVVLLLLCYYIYDNRVGFQNLLQDKLGIQIGGEEIDADEAKANEASQRYLEAEKRHIRFAGQNGFIGETNQHAVLIKGKLLDPAFKEMYDKIKDTVDLVFGSSLYFVENSHSTPYASQSRFVFDANYGLDTPTIHATADEYELRKMHAKLVYEGKAEGYRIFPEQFSSSKYIYPYDMFNDKYSDYFSAAYMEELDYEIKEVLLEFFNSEEGKDFRYSKDQRIYRDLMHLDHFTGSDKEELAVILSDVQAMKNGRNKEVLLIVAYDKAKKAYYLSYKQFFSDKIIISTVIYNEESQSYEDAHLEDSPVMPYYSLLLKVPGERDRLLHYDQEFDKMKEIYVRDLKDE